MRVLIKGGGLGVAHSVVISLKAALSEVKTSVVVIVIVPPASLVLFSVFVEASTLSVKLAFVKLALVLVAWVHLEAVFVGQLKVSLMLEVDIALVLELLLKSSAQIVLELLFLVVVVRLQVRESLVKLAHEHRVVGLAEVGVIIASKLVVSVDHMADLLHHPLNRVHWAQGICVAVHHSDGSLFDVLQRNVGSQPVLLALFVDGLGTRVVRHFDIDDLAA